FDVDVVGYSEPWSVAPGDRIRFMVSCGLDEYDVSFVRLIHGDLDPEGPGFKAEEFRTPADGRYPGRVQAIRSGSYVVVPSATALDELESFSLWAWVHPTLFPGRQQPLLGTWREPARSGYGLCLQPDGDLCLLVGDGSGTPVHARTERPLRANEWTFVACSYDHSSGAAVLVQSPRRTWPDDPSACVVAAQLAPNGLRPSGGPFLIAAGEIDDGATAVPEWHFNGKLSGPVVAGRPRGGDELLALAVSSSTDASDTI